jgi:hypothetical protein
MDDCSATSADSMIEILTPKASNNDEAFELNPVVVGGTLAGVAALVLVAQLGSMDGGAPSVATSSTPAPKVKVAPITQDLSGTSESSFSLLKEFVR